jgi:hypothetical protein
MVRPRLVEEGTPIGQADDHHDDHEMADHSSSFEGPGYAQYVAHHQSAPSAVANYSQSQHAATSANKPSSLLAAAGGKLRSKQRHQAAHATRVVIGNESPDSWQYDTNSMSDTHFEQRPPARASDPRPPPQHYSHHSHGSSSTHQPMHQYQQPRYSSAPAPPPPPPRQHVPAHSHSQHFEIGADIRPTERMEGVQDHSVKNPLIVLDGANVAYAYAQTANAADYQRGAKLEPDATGIRVACDYFLKADMRVLVVLPASWFRSKPRPGDASQGNANMLTDHLEVLHELQQTGLVLAAPPADDDDAYALTIAQRENVRAASRNGQGPGYVLSNDMFRDAHARDATGQVRAWLTAGHNQRTGPGRISFAFCDMGTMDEYGDTELDIVPNPRHPLVAWIELQQHAT